MSKICFGRLNISQISETSGLFYGKNLQVKFSNRTQVNEGFGTTNGDHNLFTSGVNLVVNPNYLLKEKQENKTKE